MAMSDEELRALLGQILEGQRELQESQLKAQQKRDEMRQELHEVQLQTEQKRQELQEQLGELTRNMTKLERIVLRHEGYHIMSESERLDLQGQMLELQRRVARLEQRDNGDANGAV